MAISRKHGIFGKERFIVRMKKGYLVALAIFSSVFLLACGRTSGGSEAGTTPSGSSGAAAPVTPAPATGANTASGNQGSGAKEKELQIYSINDDSLEQQDTTATVTCGEDGKVTAKTIVDAVVEDFQNHSIDIGIDEVTEQGAVVYVSFQNGTAPLANVGAGVESTILDCISQSLLDNLDSCTRVVFRAEGEAYVSGHFEFGKEEAYIEK